jgi:hypothetical protein
VKLSGRAHAETIVKLLEELNALAERDPAVRVLIDETDLGASERYRKDREGVAERRLARLDRDRALRFQPRVSTGWTACFKVSRTEPSG